VPLRADGFIEGVQVSWLADRRLSPPSRVVRLSGVVSAEAPRSQLRDSSGLAPDSLGALGGILALCGGLIGSGKHEIAGLA
jgi:hypothetical protein